MNRYVTFRKKYMEECVKNDSVRKVLSAIFYGFSSFSIMIINKSVLTHYHFPSFQALSIGGTKTLKTSFAVYAVDHIQVFQSVEVPTRSDVCHNPLALLW